MRALVALATGLGHVTGPLLALGRALGVACIAAMVVIILVQVFFRYVLGNALAWPDEAARFLMLWMTGLMAPTAYRRGGFVSIDMIVQMLPRRITSLVTLTMLVLSLVVLVAGFRIGMSELSGFMARAESPSLRVPASLDLSVWMKVPRSWMMMSFHTGITLLILVNVELILRALVTLFGAGDGLRPIPDAATLGAE